MIPSKGPLPLSQFPHYVQRSQDRKSECLPERAIDEAFSQQRHQLFRQGQEVIDGLTRVTLAKTLPLLQQVGLSQVPLDVWQVGQVVIEIGQQSALSDPHPQTLKGSSDAVLGRGGQLCDEVEVERGLFWDCLGEDGVYDDLKQPFKVVRGSHRTKHPLASLSNLVNLPTLSKDLVATDCHFKAVDQFILAGSNVLPGEYLEGSESSCETEVSMVLIEIYKCQFERNSGIGDSVGLSAALKNSPGLIDMRKGLLLASRLDVAQCQVVVALTGPLVGSPADLQHIHQRTLGESNRVLKLPRTLVVGREDVVQLGKDGMELSEELGGGSDELVAALDVALPRTALQLPLDRHEQQVEHPSRRTRPPRIRIDCYLLYLRFGPQRTQEQGEVEFSLWSQWSKQGRVVLRQLQTLLEFGNGLFRVWFLQDLQASAAEGLMVRQVGLPQGLHPSKVLLREQNTLLEDVLRTQSFPRHSQPAVFHQRCQEVPPLNLFEVELYSEVAARMGGKDLPKGGSLDVVAGHAVQEVAELDGYCLGSTVFLQYDILQGFPEEGFAASRSHLTHKHSALEGQRNVTVDLSQIAQVDAPLVEELRQFKRTQEVHTQGLDLDDCLRNGLQQVVRKSLSLLPGSLMQLLDGLTATIFHQRIGILANQLLSNQCPAMRLDEAITREILLNLLNEVAFEVGGGIGIDGFVILFVELDDAPAVVEVEALLDLGLNPQLTHLPFEVPHAHLLVQTHREGLEQRHEAVSLTEGYEGDFKPGVWGEMLVEEMEVVELILEQLHGSPIAHTLPSYVLSLQLLDRNHGYLRLYIINFVMPDSIAHKLQLKDLLMNRQTHVLYDGLQQILGKSQELLEDSMIALQIPVGPRERQFADEGFLIALLRLPINRGKLILNHSMQLLAIVHILLLSQLRNGELQMIGGSRRRLRLRQFCWLRVWNCPVHLLLLTRFFDGYWDVGRGFRGFIRQETARMDRLGD